MVTRSVVSIETYKAAVAAGAIIPSAAVDVSLQNTSSEQMIDKKSHAQSFNNESRTDSSQQPSQLGWINGSKNYKPCGLIQLCCYSGCVHVANFRRGYGFCPLHQAKAMAAEQSNSGESEENAFDERCISEASSDEGHGDKHLAAHGSNCSSSEVGKKRACPSEDPTSVKKMSKRQRCSAIVIDLSDVPIQTPILKIGKRKGERSKYQGVSFHKRSNKWRAQIQIKGKQHCIGRYDNEEDAGIDYARAVLKYKGQKAVDKARVQEIFVVDLSDAPMQSPILKSNKINEGQSKYRGVSFIKKSNKWEAKLVIEGKGRCIGYYDNEEEAAIDYARAVFKYKGQEGVDQSRTRAQHSFTMSLSDVPQQAPILTTVKRKEGQSKYEGVGFCFNKKSKKWKARILIKGKQQHIGYYEKEEDAAADYARAVFKYKGQKAIDEARAQEIYIRQRKPKKTRPKDSFIDLQDVPMQPLIIRTGKHIREGKSKYKGVYFDEKTNKYKAQIFIEGKLRDIGTYEDEEDAAADYARAVFKYRGQKDLTR